MAQLELVVANPVAEVPGETIPVEQITDVPTPPQAAPVPTIEPEVPSPVAIESPNEKPLSLPAKAKDWAQKNPAIAIGGVAGAAFLTTLAAAAYPLWKKVIQPRLEKMKGERSIGRPVKRSVDDEYVDELISDPEFVQFLEELAAELEE